ncbi:MAG: flagellar basal body-associated protein FliL, partial [Pseudomonadota bacterium]
MHLILPLILALIGLGAGIGAGLLLTPAPDLPATEEDGDSEGGDSADEREGEGATGSNGQEIDGDLLEYASLSNQFVIPVVKNDRIDSLVVLSLTLEVAPGATPTVFQREPRLRDGFLRVMFDHANIGGFDTSFTQSGNLTILRAGLLDVA